MFALNSPRFVFGGALCIHLLLLFPAFGQSGILNVSSQPTGASVWLDEQEIGNSPIINYSVKAGSHKLQLTDPNSNKTVIRVIQISADSTSTFEIPLDVSYGNLTVECVQKNSKVSLSTNLGATPLNNARLISGDYTIKIESANQFFRPITKSVTIPVNGTEQVKVDLPKNKSRIIKVGSQVLLGLAAIGSSAIGYVHDDKGARGVCFTVSTICVLGVGVLLFF
jgi:hypothetical protein